jgi:lysophospholipase L1-like esterase
VEQHLLSVSFALAPIALSLACASRPSAGPTAAAPHPSQTATPVASSAPSSNAPDGPVLEAGRAANENAFERAKDDSGPNSGAEHTRPAPLPELPRGTLVLHVGDSFAGSLGVPLAQRLKARGLRSVLEYQTSSYVPTWASGKELPQYVSRYNPDLVIITLGANEFELANPEQRAASVRRLVNHLGGRPCVWVTPPRWKQDTGILAVIYANLKPCRFLDSDTIVPDLERKQDKIHPSDAGRERWADAVLAWLEHERRGESARPWDLKDEGE